MPGKVFSLSVSKSRSLKPSVQYTLLSTYVHSPWTTEHQGGF